MADLLEAFIESYYSMSEKDYFPNGWDGISKIDPTYKPYANKTDYDKYVTQDKTP